MLSYHVREFLFPSDRLYTIQSRELKRVFSISARFVYCARFSLVLTGGTHMGREACASRIPRPKNTYSRTAARKARALRQRRPWRVVASRGWHSAQPPPPSPQAAPGPAAAGARWRSRTRRRPGTRRRSAPHPSPSQLPLIYVVPLRNRRPRSAGSDLGGSHIGYRSTAAQPAQHGWSRSALAPAPWES